MSPRLAYTAFAAPWERLGAGPGADIAHPRLLAAWSEPHRAYHTLAHLEACLQAFDTVRDQAVSPDAIELALWYHDAVYAPLRGDNEARSAAWAEADLARSPARASIAALVYATRHAEPEADADTRLLIDIDLGVLGAPRARYARYEAEVRSEYRWVPAPIFRKKRAALLAGFLSRPTVYTTAAFAHLEQDARANLTWAITQLGGHAPRGSEEHSG